jgi:hypothetical protein
MSKLGQCGTEHDPEPWVSYTMMTGQTGWRGQDRFTPRPEFCQDIDCYYPKTEMREQ